MQGGKSSIFYADIGEIPKFVTHEVPALDNAAPRMDPKLCPGDVNYMAFYRNGNLWLQNIGIIEVRLSKSHHVFRKSRRNRSADERWSRRC